MVSILIFAGTVNQKIRTRAQVQLDASTSSALLPFLKRLTTFIFYLDGAWLKDVGYCLIPRRTCELPEVLSPFAKNVEVNISFLVPPSDVQ